MVTKISDIDLKISYDTYEDNPIMEFLVPMLENSIRYDRAVGYFSSAIMSVVAEAFTGFASRGGKMRLVCSPVFSFEDALKIEDHIGNLSSGQFDLKEIPSDVSSDLAAPIDLMIQLINMGALELKIAVPKPGLRGMFHQKIGLFQDEEGSTVAFQGSNNETLRAWMLNSESFSIYQEWRGEFQRSHAENIRLKFEKFWTNTYPDFDFYDLDKASEFIKKRPNPDRNLEDLRKRVRQWVAEKESGGTKEITQSFKLRDYQLEAVENWFKRNRGVVSFATGVGKTVTALEIIRRWIEEKCGSVLILVPSVRLQKQWFEEIIKFPKLSDSSIMMVGGDSDGKMWRNFLKPFSAKSSEQASNKRIVLAVMDSAAKEGFINRFSWGDHVLLVADEMHNLGASGFAKLLEVSVVGGALGLSATPKRFDEDETLKLRTFFGDDLDPVKGIKEAQDLGVLVQYSYHFETVELTNAELQEYEDLSAKIGKASAIDSSRDNMHLTILKMKRAKILKSASRKVSVAENIIRKNYVPGQTWLVFCDDSKQLEALRDAISDLWPLIFHQGMDGDQDATLEQYKQHGGILLAIHMMTEGVDIPSIDRALIVASSQSEREYIQRRGRVLRVNKDRAKDVHIWDILAIDSDGYAFTDSEIRRAVEFARLAINRAVEFELLELVANTAS